MARCMGVCRARATAAMSQLVFGMNQRGGSASSPLVLQREGYQLRSNEIATQPSWVKQDGRLRAARSTFAARWYSSRLSDFLTQATATAISNWARSFSET